MGQGKLCVTPLQVANAMAVISRGGVFRFPRLFKEESVGADAVDLGISGQTMNTVRDGMHAVVYEISGTAQRAFEQDLPKFKQAGVTVFGKTGSTQPAHAWFAGFAEDSGGNSIAIAVEVEGGQSGASNAAPLGCDIMQFCIDAGYLGQLEITDPNL